MINKSTTCCTIVSCYNLEKKGEGVRREKRAVWVLQSKNRTEAWFSRRDRNAPSPIASHRIALCEATSFHHSRAPRKARRGRWGDKSVTRAVLFSRLRALHKPEIRTTRVDDRCAWFVFIPRCESQARRKSPHQERSRTAMRPNPR